MLPAAPCLSPAAAIPVSSSSVVNGSISTCTQTQIDKTQTLKSCLCCLFVGRNRGNRALDELQLHAVRLYAHPHEIVFHGKPCAPKTAVRRYAIAGLQLPQHLLPLFLLPLVRS